jgi:DNA-binding LacI/PurR family transcriptional regulator
MSKIRIIDVATLANVSKSTVSQYLNGRFGHMSAQTKDRIREAVDALNYIPNPIARSLKSDKTKTIGVIVRDITGFNTSRILRGIDDFCKKKGYNVLIYNTDFDEEVEKRSLLTLRQMRVDGIIITSTGKNAKLINEYSQTGFPIVQFQLEYDDCQTNIVISDDREASQQATEYLIRLGHQRICFMTQDFEGNVSRTERYQGYINALRLNEIPLDNDLIQYWDRETGFHYSPIQLLKTKHAPTAFFTQNLPITTELLKQFNLFNIDVPEQVSVVGFDDIPMVEMFKVPVTVVQQDSYNIGIESAKLLLDKLMNETPSKQIQKVVVPCSLAKRSSCRKID